MSQDLKKIIRQEYIKCATDPVHFMKKYCFIQHPQRGKILFTLYPFQEKVLHLFKDNPYSLILKSRQLGISTLTAGYSLWMMLWSLRILMLHSVQHLTQINLEELGEFFGMRAHELWGTHTLLKLPMAELSC